MLYQAPTMLQLNCLSDFNLQTQATGASFQIGCDEPCSFEGKSTDTGYLCGETQGQVVVGGYLSFNNLTCSEIGSQNCKLLINGQTVDAGATCVISSTGRGCMEGASCGTLSIFECIVTSRVNSCSSIQSVVVSCDEGQSQACGTFIPN
ncbi:MAG: hypothetical protein Q8Q33_05345 [Chlamydiota bacterium]|nr:hypothetical protein [Chlamydiota bacterium]